MNNIALYEYDTDSGALAPGSSQWATDLVVRTDETCDIVETIQWDHRPTIDEIEQRHDVRLGDATTMGIGDYDTQWRVLPADAAATRTIRIYCDPYSPGLGWDTHVTTLVDEEYDSGAYGPELATSAEAHVALLDLRLGRESGLDVLRNF